MTALLEPLQYGFMVKALISAAAVGGVCALLSVYLMLKGWSLIGDALSHAVVPGVALAYLWKLPYALGAFTTGILAASAMLVLKRLPMLRQDAIIGLVFTTFSPQASSSFRSIRPASIYKRSSTVTSSASTTTTSGKCSPSAPSRSRSSPPNGAT